MMNQVNEVCIENLYDLLISINHTRIGVAYYIDNCFSRSCHHSMLDFTDKINSFKQLQKISDSPWFEGFLIDENLYKISRGSF